MTCLQDQVAAAALQQELESLLYDIDYHGFIALPLRKLYRLLGRGNRAAGTWAALLDAWEAIEGNRGDLHIVELANETILITNVATEPVQQWAQEL